MIPPALPVENVIQPVARFGQIVHTAKSLPTPEPCRLQCDEVRQECPQPSRVARGPTDGDHPRCAASRGFRANRMADRRGPFKGPS